MRDCLLLVDLFNDFQHEDGDLLLACFRDRFPALSQLLQTSRDRTTPIIYANDSSGVFDGDASGIVERARGGPVGRLAQAIAPTQEDRFIVKPRYSAFDHTPLSACPRRSRDRANPACWHEHRRLCGSDRDRRPRKRVQGHRHRVGVLHRRSRTRGSRARVSRARCGRQGRRLARRGDSYGRRARDRLCPATRHANGLTGGEGSTDARRCRGGGTIVQELPASRSVCRAFATRQRVGAGWLGRERRELFVCSCALVERAWRPRSARARLPRVRDRRCNTPNTTVTLNPFPRASIAV